MKTSNVKYASHIQQVLGYRDLRNTIIYINVEKALFQNATDEFHVKLLKT